jgi:hypothetical protein
MECLWNIPCGFHVDIPYGFHLFHVEYAWNKNTNLGEISSKTYFIWNGWNPSGMTWIPPGFHVECGGRVKTSPLLILSKSLPTVKWASLSEVAAIAPDVRGILAEHWGGAILE